MAFLIQIYTWSIEKLSALADWIFEPTNPLFGIILGSIFTLAGVLLANRNSLTLARQQNSHESKIEKKNLSRVKLEELYMQISQWEKIVSSKGLSHVSAMNGDITYNDYLDSFISEGRSSDFKLERLELLANVYAPSIKQQFDIAIQYVIEKLNPIETDFRKYYKENGRAYSFEEKNEPITAYIARLEALDILIKHMKDQVAKMIREEL